MYRSLYASSLPSRRWTSWLTLCTRMSSWTRAAWCVSCGPRPSVLSWGMTWSWWTGKDAHSHTHTHTHTPTHTFHSRTHAIYPVIITQALWGTDCHENKNTAACSILCLLNNQPLIISRWSLWVSLNIVKYVHYWNTSKAINTRWPGGLVGGGVNGLYIPPPTGRQLSKCLRNIQIMFEYPKLMNDNVVIPTLECFLSIALVVASANHHGLLHAPLL